MMTFTQIMTIWTPGISVQDHLNATTNNSNENFILHDTRPPVATWLKISSKKVLLGVCNHVCNHSQGTYAFLGCSAVNPF